MFKDHPLHQRAHPRRLCHRPIAQDREHRHLRKREPTIVLPPCLNIPFLKCAAEIRPGAAREKGVGLANGAQIVGVGAANLGQPSAPVDPLGEIVAQELVGVPLRVSSQVGRVEGNRNPTPYP